jgi:hypothetical protein
LLHFQHFLHPPPPTSQAITTTFLCFSRKPDGSGVTPTRSATANLR